MDNTMTINLRELIEQRGLRLQEDVYKRQANKYQKQIQNNIKLQNQQEASLAKLRTQLALDLSLIHICRIPVTPCMRGSVPCR